MNTKINQNIEHLKTNIKIAPYIATVTFIISLYGGLNGDITIPQYSLLLLVGVFWSVLLYFHWAKNRFILLALSVLVPLLTFTYIFDNADNHSPGTKLLGVSTMLCVATTIISLFRKKYIAYAMSKNNRIETEHKLNDKRN